MDSGFCPLECEVGKLNKSSAPNEHHLIILDPLQKCFAESNSLYTQRTLKSWAGETAEKYMGLTCRQLAVGCNSMCAHLIENFLLRKAGDLVVIHGQALAMD